ncbi:DeoR faimly transcriptional regulator [Novosphingobium barchaimii LL02]|uniref:DeoR faimly transcriptional regulator n=1 Tax=Novosphingobium barchaimii LL02 TaxID=1114963 RepID=A0A0J7XJJ5_9SPHN|nr:PLP-dependent aminotransferase family protein [Novosphingobium barchaimii]KMS51829.1 DeoR faimly transcriptional regulator [Novosphingobium barchaimii LL02]
MTISALSPISLARQLGAWRGATGGGAAYRQLARAIRLLIADGRIGLGVRIGGERDLAQALGMSRTTVSAAFDLLRDEGYLVTRQGSGSVTRLPGVALRGGSGTADIGEFDDADDARHDIIDWTKAALPAPPTIWHAYEQALGQMPAFLSGIGYEVFGIRRLRVAIAADYAARGCPTTPDQIFVTSGAQHGLSLLLHLLAGPGDRIVVDHPTYHNAIAAILRHSCVAVPVGLPIQGWDIDAFHAAFRQTSPRFAYILADFHNPTGRLMDADTRAKLVRAARDTHTPLVVDETMTNIALDVSAPPSVAAYDPEGEMVISLGSASKRFWGGLRIGWIRAAPQTIVALSRLRETLDMATPVLEQLAVAALLENSPRDDMATWSDVRARRDQLIARLESALPHWRVSVPPGGFMLWAEMPRPEASALAAMARCLSLRITPGPRFGVNGAFERFIRLPFTLPETALDRAVDRLIMAEAHLRSAGARIPDRAAWDLEAERVI